MMGLGVQRLVGGLAVCLVAALVFGAQVAAADPVGQITEFSSGLNNGSRPASWIAPGPDGNLWFTDSGTTPAIGRITPGGAITEFSSGLNPGSFPLGIAPGPDGNLWFTDPGATPAIGRITPGGAITEFSSGLNPGSEPIGIAAGADGNLWFTDPGRPGDRADHPGRDDHRVLKRLEPRQRPERDRSGARRQPVVHRLCERPGDRADHPGRGDHRVLNRPAPRQLPAGIAAGPDGNLWFTDAGATRAIGRITPGGAITEFSTGLNAGSEPSGSRRGPTATCGSPTPGRRLRRPGDWAGHPGRGDHRVLKRLE